MIAFLQNIEFANKGAFFLFIIPAIMIVWWVYNKNKSYPVIKLSSLAGIKGFENNFRGILKQGMPMLRILTLVLFVIALARPQTTLKEEEISADGIDIVIAMDVSGSMLAQDFKPNRLEASKEKAIEFIEGRKTDRIGLVVFAGESFTQCPITTDYDVLKGLVNEVKEGLIEDGTAIGMGLATAINRLKDGETKSKVVILLTDGDNNSGFIDPLTAVDAAIQFNVRVYTIGVGTRGEAPYPFNYGGQIVYQNRRVNINEDLLKEVANKTGGKYYRATDNESLQSIYTEIDELETSKIQVATIQRVSEEFFPFVLIGSIFFLLDILLRYTYLRSIP